MCWFLFTFVQYGIEINIIVWTKILENYIKTAERKMYYYTSPPLGTHIISTIAGWMHVSISVHVYFLL